MKQKKENKDPGGGGGILVEKPKQPKIKDKKNFRNNFHNLLNIGAIFLLDTLVAAQRHQLLQVPK